MSTFDLTIVTPGGEAFAGETEYLSVVLPDGRAGFMKGALPRVCVLAAGEISVKSPWDEKRFKCGDGVMRIADNGAVIVTSVCEALTEDNNGLRQGEKSDDGQVEYTKVKISQAFRKDKH